MKHGSIFRTCTVGAVVVLALGACSRLDHLGEPPSFKPSGNIVSEAPAITSERLSIASGAPRRQRPSAPEASTARAATNASLWRFGPSSLFGDRRAQGRGDILTVVIEIDEEASISNATQRTRSASEDLSVTALFGLPELVQDVANVALDPGAQLSSGSQSGGDGSVQREEQITLRLAASVTDVLPNGHFVIAGNQEVRVNFELRELSVRGVVRPEDISRANEITYDRIADARISYGGRGQITDVQQPRYGQQIADIVLPF